MNRETTTTTIMATGYLFKYKSMKINCQTNSYSFSPFQYENLFIFRIY